MKISVFLRPIIGLIGVLAVSGCSMLMYDGGSRDAVSTSLVDFLYPDGQGRRSHAGDVPVIKLPVRVGLAFVPSKQWRANGFHESQQLQLLEQVKQEFEQFDYIEKIEVIPSAYLGNDGGFESLDRVSRLYDVDVMALVSYDQMRRSEENTSSLLYWTIVGAYLIPGNDNRVQTFVDTAVFDIKSRQLLFRAPGLSKLEDSSSAIKIDESIRQQSAEGFGLAMTDMRRNLNQELSTFKDKVRNEKIAKIEHRAGYSGAGAFYALVLLFIYGGLRGFSRRQGV